MKRFMLLGPLVLVAALLLVPAAAQGQAQTLRLDQSQLLSDVSTPVADNQLLVAQTFTAGVTGTLTQVKLELAVSLDGTPTGNLTVAIYATSSGSPTGSALGSGTVSPSSLTTDLAWVSVTISPVPVRAGTQYAIVLSDYSDTFPIAYEIGTSTANPYAGGGMFVSPDGAATWYTIVGMDFAFQTYVSSSSQTNQGQNGNGQGQNQNGQGHNH